MKKLKKVLNELKERTYITVIDLEEVEIYSGSSWSTLNEEDVETLERLVESVTAVDNGYEIVVR